MRYADYLAFGESPTTIATMLCQTIVLFEHPIGRSRGGRRSSTSMRSFDRDGGGPSHIGRGLLRQVLELVRVCPEAR